MKATRKKKTSKAANGVLPLDVGLPVKSICVYCGSGHGDNPLYANAARVLGTAMAKAGVGLVYGGGGLGLMGEVARAVLDAGGHVTGIMPQFLKSKESLLEDVQETIITRDMHERKQLMFQRSDAFVALPGGIGTLEELVEQLTWAQLGRHTKPIIVADIGGFWQPLFQLLGHMRDQHFIRDRLRVSFIAVSKAEDILPTVLRASAAAGGAGAGLDPAFTRKF